MYQERDGISTPLESNIAFNLALLESIKNFRSVESCSALSDSNSLSILQQYKSNIATVAYTLLLREVILKIGMLCTETSACNSFL